MGWDTGVTGGNYEVKDKISRKPAIICWGNLLTWHLGFDAALYVFNRNRNGKDLFISASQRIKKGASIGFKKFCRCGSYISKLAGDQ